MRKELIEHKIGEIIDNINIISENMPVEFEDFVNSRLSKHGLYKLVEFTIQNFLDICSIINSDLNLGMPENEDVIINHLESKKIFSEKAIDIIRQIKGFRNILVHKYGEIDDKKAFENISEGLNDFDIIIKEFESFIKKYAERENKKGNNKNQSDKK